MISASNTDGILVRFDNPSDFDKYIQICNEWIKGTRLEFMINM